MRERLKAIILIEHKEREAKTAIDLKKEFVSVGDQVLIGNIYIDARFLIKNFVPDLVFVPFLYSEDDKIIRQYLLSWPNSIFINMAYEQILYPLNSLVKVPRYSENSNRIYTTSWSKQYTSQLLGNGISSKTIIKTGHPFFILENRKRETRFELDKCENIIFFENYTWLFKSNRYLKKYAQKLNIDSKILDEIKEEFKDNLIRTIKLFHRIRKNNSKILINIKLRPNSNYFSWIFFMIRNRIYSKEFKITKILPLQKINYTNTIIMSNYSTLLIKYKLENYFTYSVSKPNAPLLQYDWINLIDEINSETFENKEIHQGVVTNNSILDQKFQTWFKENFYQNHDLYVSFLRKESLNKLIGDVSNPYYPVNSNKIRFDEKKFYKNFLYIFQGLLFIKNHGIKFKIKTHKSDVKSYLCL